jgi:hypothetical protein
VGLSMRGVATPGEGRRADRAEARQAARQAAREQRRELREARQDARLARALGVRRGGGR